MGILRNFNANREAISYEKGVTRFLHQRVLFAMEDNAYVRH